MNLEQRQRETWYSVLRRNKQAQKDRYWIEAICLSYTMLEVTFWFLLERNGVSDQRIDELCSLIQLANFARSKGFIDSGINRGVQEFNDTRRLVIHRFVRGEICYDDLEPALSGVDKLRYDIANC